MKYIQQGRKAALAFGTAVCFYAGVAAGWSGDPTVNTPVYPQSHNQDIVQSIADGSGGVIIVWQDYRNASISDLYAQRYNAYGARMWSEEGVAIADNEIWHQFTPRIVSDNSGGAIITWLNQDNVNGADIYAQRIDSDGNRLWGENGIIICNAPNGRDGHQLTSDGIGGAIITWSDQRVNLDNRNIYAQKVSPQGSVQWTANGVVVCNADGSQIEPGIISDSGVGAIITWIDYRGDSGAIYAQRLDETGAAQWAANGVVVADQTSRASSPKMVPDEAGGAVVAWVDHRNTTPKIYAQRFANSGTMAWTANGVELTPAVTAEQSELQLISDEAGGAIVTYEQYSLVSMSDIYAQHIQGSGTVLWSNQGAVVSDAPDEQQFPALTSNGMGGAIITWQDSRNGGNDIYAQNVSSAAGSSLWQTGGVVITNALASDFEPEISPDASNGAYITWRRFANSVSNIIAQRIMANGTIGTSPSAVDGWELFQ